MSDSDQPLESFFLATAPYALRKTKQREIFKAKQTKRGRKAGPPSRKALQQPHEYVEEPIITTNRPEPNTQPNPLHSTFSTATRVQNTSNPCPKDSPEHHEHEEILNEGHYRPQSREIDDCPTTTPESPPKSAENRNFSTPPTKIAPKVRTIERPDSGEAAALATIPAACENITFSTASDRVTDHSTRLTSMPDLQSEISPSNRDEIQPNFDANEAPRGTELRRQESTSIQLRLTMNETAFQPLSSSTTSLSASITSDFSSSAPIPAQSTPVSVQITSNRSTSALITSTISRFCPLYDLPSFCASSLSSFSSLASLPAQLFSASSSSSQHPTRPQLTQGSFGTRESTIQTDDSLDCHHCRWIAKIWGEPLITTSGRSLFTYRLALHIQQLDEYILRYCGRQTAQLVGSALHGIPTTLIGPLLQLINVSTHYPPDIDCPPPLIHHMALPHIFIVHHTLLYIFRIEFDQGVLRLLTHITPTQRRGITPTVISIFQDLLERFLNEALDITLRYINPHFASSIPTIFQHLTCIVRYECRRLHATHLSIQPQNSDASPLTPRTREAFYQPQPLTPPKNLASDQLLTLFYSTLQQFNTSTTNTRSQTTTPTTLRPTSTTTDFASPRPASPSPRISDDTSIEVVQPDSPHSSDFGEVHEPLLNQDNMANSSLRRERDASPMTDSIRRMETVDDAASDLSRRNTDLPLAAWQESVQKATRDAVSSEMRQLWDCQIAPHITRTVHESIQPTRQQLHDVQQQVTNVRQSLHDELQRPSTRASYSGPEQQLSNPNTAIRSFFATRQRDTDTVTMNATTRLEWADTVEHTQPSRTTTNLPPINNNNSTPSQQWIDSFAAAMERRQKPKAIDLQQFLADSRPPMLTEDDMQRFARKSPERLTEQQTHAFADQLEQYLMHDRDNYDFIEEGHALRKLAQYMKWRTLASWLQLYANPTIRFRFSKREFWRRKYDEHAHHCMPQPHHTPDITESIDRLARGLEARLDLRESSQSRNNPNFRNQTPYQRNQSNDRFQNQPRPFQNNFNRNNYTNGNQNNCQNRLRLSTK